MTEFSTNSGSPYESNFVIIVQLYYCTIQDSHCYNKLHLRHITVHRGIIPNPLHHHQDIHQDKLMRCLYVCVNYNTTVN